MQLWIILPKSENKKEIISTRLHLFDCFTIEQCHLNSVEVRECRTVMDTFAMIRNGETGDIHKLFTNNWFLSLQFSMNRCILLMLQSAIYVASNEMPWDRLHWSVWLISWFCMSLKLVNVQTYKGLELLSLRVRLQCWVELAGLGWGRAG